MKEMVFYPGCVIPNRYPGVEKTMYYAMEKLGYIMKPMEGYSCCPPPGIVRSVDEELWFSLATRNLSLYDDRTIMTACNGCFATLFDANRLSGNGEREIRHVVEFLYRDVGLEKIKARVTKFLPLKVAVHYGCHLLRPSIYREVDSPENPVILDVLVEAVGAESVPYPTKMVCCGGGGGVRAGHREVALEILKRKLTPLKVLNVDCIVVVCPLCQHQFDVGQVELKNEGVNFNIPVLHYSQLLATAFGLELEMLGLEAHTTMTENLQEKLEKGEDLEQ